MASLALPIGLISSLNRAEEVSVPRCPAEFTKTAAPSTAVAPLIPPDKGGGNTRVTDSNGIALTCQAGRQNQRMRAEPESRQIVAMTGSYLDPVDFP